MKLVFQLGGVPQSEWKLHELIPGGIPSGQWVKVSIPASLVSPESGLVDTIIVADESGTDQSALLLDLMRFVDDGASQEQQEPEGTPGEEPAGEEPGEQPAEEELGEEPGNEVPQEPGEVLPLEEIDGISFYRDGLGEQIQDFGWADHSIDETAIAHTGAYSIRMEPDNGGAIYLYSGIPIVGEDYTSFEAGCDEPGGRLVLH